MNIIILFCFILRTYFHSLSKIKQSSVIFCNNNDNNSTKDTFVLPIDFSKIIQEYDNNVIEQLLGDLPKSPETEEEIIEDSFEGFLRNEFYSIATNKLINFETYYIWRKQAGIVLNETEVKNIYDSIVRKGELCDLMNFITINNIIDEGNAGWF